MRALIRASVVSLCISLCTSAAEWQVIGWNDLGMHCMDGTDFSVFSILPPFNTIHAHVIHNGNLVTNTNSLTVTYEAIADPDGSINTTSANKINFWEHVADMFGAQPADDVGLSGAEMPGASNTPRPMEFDTAHNWFTGEGIPLTPFDDAGNVNYYPMMKIVVKSNGTEVASTRIVLPVSDEMTCSACHQSGSDASARPSVGWRWHPDADKDVKLNILRLHDEKQQANPAFFQSLENQGFNTNGLYQTVVADGTAILCARCHHSNALPDLPVDPHTTNTMTQAMHRHHGAVNDPDAPGMTLNDSANRDSCYRCHPGSATRCLRGAMGASVAADGSLAIQCQSCHGPMSRVGSASRQGWFDEPKCQSCHPGVNGTNPIRYRTVFESGTTERIPANTTFAHPTGTLYRFSTGHSDLQCSTCHGSPHAIFPSSHLNDNLQNIDMQGHQGTVVECLNCHTSQPRTFNGGPHGMHPVGDTAFSRKADSRPENWFHGQVHEDGNIGIASCKNCHGADYRGTVLSRAQADRTIGSRTFWRGQQIGCYTCHNGPNSENNNNNSAPTVTSTSAFTTANAPVAIPLTANEGTIRIVSQAQNGTVGLSGSTATYIPFFNFTGSDSFTFASWNGEKDSNLGTVTITVSAGTCVLTCEAVVPTGGPARTELPFWSHAVVSNCTDSVSYLWDFGDGGSSTDALAQHAYTTNGTYAWQLVTSAAGLAVTNSGTVTTTDIRLDSDGDGIEDDWEWAVFQTLETASATSDSDHDGQGDFHEYLAGTNPNDASSRLEITSISGGLIQWSSEPNRSYTVQSTTSLVYSAFAPVATGRSATPPENSLAEPFAAQKKYFRVILE